MPKPWRLIKDEMEALKEDFVGYERFRALCREHGIDEVGEQDTLLTLLNNLGIALNFDALKVYNRAVLKPEWLTQAVYRIINAYQTAEQFGSFHAGEVGRLLDDRKYGKDKVDPGKYPPETYEFIGEVMRIFELCYPLASNNQGRAYMIPELLKVEEDDGGFVTDGCARLTISYPGFLPPSVFSRFIVQMHPWLVKEYCWRTGVRLRYAHEDAEGLVKLDRQDRKIEIWTSGTGGRRLMEFIRDTFTGLHAEFDGLVAQELVPLEKEQFVDYEELVGYEKEGITIFFSGVLRKKFFVKDLLDPIESAQRRKENLIPVDVFVSYSHQYPEHKEKFVSHMSVYKKGKKVKLWEDGQIKPGEAWLKEIWNAHGRAQIVVCLISAEFIQSDYCNDKEFKAAIEKEDKEEADVILVQVEACHWQMIPEMERKQIIPSKPVASYENVNDGWFEVVKALEPIIEKWHQRINSGRPPYDSRNFVHGKLR
jgi:internalin A